MKTLRQLLRQEKKERQHSCIHCHTAGAIYEEEDTVFHLRTPPEYRVIEVTLYFGQLACRYCHRLQTEEGDYA